MGGQHWVVIGGGGKGGILVREGESLKSSECPNRLATGAVIEETALVGERLEYKKVSGEGPAKGWVSLKLKGVDLLEKTVVKPEKKKPAPPPELSRDESLRMQKDLLHGFSQDEFQNELKELGDKYPDKEVLEFKLARGKIIQAVQKTVCQKYGFDATPRGVAQMVKLLGEVSNNDPEFGRIGFEINVELGLVERPPPPPKARAPAGIEDFTFTESDSKDATATVAATGEGASAEATDANAAGTETPGTEGTSAPEAVPPGQPPMPDGHEPGRLNLFGLEGIPNFRDVAGIDPASRPRKVRGGTLRPGLLYRTGTWTIATESDIAKLLGDIGIKTYFDLRQGRNLALESLDGAVWDAYPPSPSGRHDGEELRPAGEPRRLHFDLAQGTAYRELTEDELANKVPEDDRRAQTNLWYQLEFRKMFQEGFSLEKHLAFLNSRILFGNDDKVLAALQACTERKNYPLAFGCMTGKDRTGLISMLILKALGASVDEIMEDYLITNLASVHLTEVQIVNHTMVKAKEEAERKAAEDQAKAASVQDAETKAADATPVAAPATAPEGSNISPEAGNAMPATAPTAVAESGNSSPEEAQPAVGGQGAADKGSIASNEANLKAAKVFRKCMECTLHVLEREGGGISKYLDSIGFGPGDVARLREILVEENGDEGGEGLGS